MLNKGGLGGGGVSPKVTRKKRTQGWFKAVGGVQKLTKKTKGTAGLHGKTHKGSLGKKGKDINITPKGRWGKSLIKEAELIRLTRKPG